MNADNHRNPLEIETPLGTMTETEFYDRACPACVGAGWKMAAGGKTLTCTVCDGAGFEAADDKPKPTPKPKPKPPDAPPDPKKSVPRFG